MLNLDSLSFLFVQKHLVVGVIFFLSGLDYLLRTLLPPSTIICNPGIAWGFPLPQMLIVSVTITLLLLFFGLWMNEKRALQKLGWLLLIVGGAMNGLDRFFFGCVRDYLSLPPFPSFNVADMMLVLGVGVLAWAMTRRQA